MRRLSVVAACPCHCAQRRILFSNMGLLYCVGRREPTSGEKLYCLSALLRTRRFAGGALLPLSLRA